MLCCALCEAFWYTKLKHKWLIIKLCRESQSSFSRISLKWHKFVAEIVLKRPNHHKYNSSTSKKLFLPPAKKLREGYVFTGVCDSVHGGSGVFSVPSCTTGHMTKGSLSGGVFVQGVSVKGDLCRGEVSVKGDLCRGEVSVQGDLCPGGLCPGGVSVQGGLCPGGLCPGGVSVWGVSVQGVSLSRGVSVRETPHTVMSRRYASYWNAFFFYYLLNFSYLIFILIHRYIFIMQQKCLI